ncbi:ABC transporter substrate-binding protein [Microbacterium azadirachtae]|uniref:ABC transporter substrate-binding protein n=1 Tax=Microbacterium azadirachtae TaxID=582680 RepID=UPI00088B7962|nr:extracellular solute-binding protein [Microbacterium azadirachtae]SDL65356.1 ABC-type glycerol-3-phosphate transport system, substrate-binding protein [Microbacterium azadirachtae]SEF94652.1 ABC-type glycerol-3-phosphate transport system, substrate-binding protein [Microbacterium azadirachtae]SEF97263.1 ABC-type glycerol-3-phosphate transport system, substrate-binding protein [Microbacterium azadirachtae]
MKMNLRWGAALAATAAVGLALSACTASGSTAPSTSSGPVTITVMGIPATTKPAARQAFMDDIAAFEKANPNITVTPTDEKWNPQSYVTELAGGTAPTLLWVPLTDPPGLIARKQVADLTDDFAQLPSSKQFNSKVLEPLKGNGKLYGIPTAEYALGLAYNRDLFTKAGLDPDKPPTTWKQVETAAKTITEATGVPGFAEMTAKSSGGWHLTAGTYSYGGTMETLGKGGKYSVQVDNPDAVSYLKQLQTMRWKDKSMSENALLGYDDINSGFAAGKYAMIISAPDYYTNYIQQYQGDPNTFGITAYPQAGGNTTLAGGSVAMVNAKATKAQTAAAVKWIDYHWLRPQYDTKAAASLAKSNAAANIPVGIPAVPLFNSATQEKIAAAIKPYVTIKTTNFEPFINGTAKLQLKAEPPVAAQLVYQALDPVMQAILTRQDADPETELKKAQSAAEQAVAQAQQ